MSDKPNPIRHLIGAAKDLHYLDKVTQNVVTLSSPVDKQRDLQRLKKWNENEAVTLAISMALENSEMFEDFCESQYPTQGRILFNALKRAQKHAGVIYRSKAAKERRDAF